MPEGEEIPGQGLVFDTGWGQAEAGDDALGIDGKRQMKAFIPAQAVAPANVSLTGQPAGAPAFANLVGTPELSRACPYWTGWWKKAARVP